ncbi:hypothetical protein, partial [Prosthecobacter sp.]|uniref:hypothetical protein n=1 Tax=Prosthecobacter sp. TaxID=1965333 RepID=UPI0037C8B212
LTDATKPARSCNMLYPLARDSCLRSHRWNFAQRRATLSRLSTDPLFGWAAAYALPIDCLRVLSLNGETEEESMEFDVEGKNLLTDETLANVMYTAKVEDTEQFDPLFVDALSVLLASKLAVSLTGSQSRTDSLMTEYARLTRPLAVKVDAQESKPRKNYMPGIAAASHFIAARFSGISIPQTEP